MVVALAWPGMVQPLWLFLALTAVAPVLMAIRRAGGTSPTTRLGLALQAAAILLLSLALARPVIVASEGDVRPWLVLQDVSASTRGQEFKAPHAGAAWMRRQEFADSLGTPSKRLVGDSTNLTPALRYAQEQARQCQGIVIATDGQCMDPWQPAAEALGQCGRKVLVVPFDSPGADAGIAGLTAIRLGGQVELKAAIQCGSRSQRRTLRMWRADRPGESVLRRDIQMLAGETAIVRAADPVDDSQGEIEYRAELSPADAFPENDSARVIVESRNPPVALVAGGGQFAADGLSSGILGRPVRRLAAGDAPADEHAWQGYAAVVLVDGTGEALAASQRKSLARYVRDGGGLVLVGAGPYRGAADRQDPLNQVSALVVNPWQRRPLDVAVLLDASGSMAEPAGPSGQLRKFDLAGEAVTSLANHLTDRDSLAVFTFSEAARAVYDSGPETPDFVKLGRALADVHPGGPTTVAGALEMAVAHPPRAGRMGLAIVVSDLQTRLFDVEPLARLFKQNGWSLAVVAIEDGVAAPAERPSLERLSEALGCPMTRQDTLQGLADILGRFVENGRGQAIRRGDFHPVCSGALGLASRPLPAIDAYLLCAAGEGADLLAAVGNDPILARRAVALGRCVSLALPLDERNNRPLQSWPGLEGLLAEAVAWVSRPGEDPRFSGSLDARSGRLHLTLEAREANLPLDLLDLVAGVELPEANQPAVVHLLETGCGRYEADVVAAVGPVRVLVRDAQGARVWSGAYLPAAGAEFAAIGPNWENLRLLARLTHGRIVGANELEGAITQVRMDESVELWPALLGASLLAMLCLWLSGGVMRRKPDAAAKRTGESVNAVF